MDALVPQSTHDAGAPRRSPVRKHAGRAVAVLAAGGCFALFGATGVAGAATTTAPDVSPIFCVAGTACSGASGSSSTTSVPSKQAVKAAEKAAKKAAPKPKDLKSILGDSSLIDNGGHKWG